MQALLEPHEGAQPVQLHVCIYIIHSARRPERVLSEPLSPRNGELGARRLGPQSSHHRLSSGSL